MSKEEFLLELRRALAGEVSQNVIQENLLYYDNYISDEVRKGATEESVIELIGSPRLIARTIIDADEGNTESGAGYSSYGEEYQDNSSDRTETPPFGGQNTFHMYNLNKWYVKLAVMAVLFLIIFLVVTVIGGIFTLLAPIMGPFFLILLLVWLFRGMRR